jgi:hypothetical protein
MRQPISVETLNMLSSLKMKGLLFKDRLMLLQDYAIERVTETPKKSLFNRHPEPQEKIYLTGMKLWGYNEDGKFLGTINDDMCNHLILHYNFYDFRRKYEVLKESFNALGFDIKPIEKPKTEDHD